MSDRTTILAQIRRSLEANRARLEHEVALHGGEPPAGPFMPATLAPVEQFKAELEALQGHVHLCADPEAALVKVRDLLVAHDVHELLHWDWEAIPLPGLADVVRDLGIRSANGTVLRQPDRAERIRALEPVPFCISGADAAIAESGTLAVISGPGRNRLASLLPPVHLAILPAEVIVRSLPDAFALLAARWGDDVVQRHSNITLITGPSRTADIEQSLTLGVHGPKEIHVVVVGAAGEQA
jgi:L-lactate dehydrogenase complex protein LldG